VLVASLFVSNQEVDTDIDGLNIEITPEGGGWETGVP